MLHSQFRQASTELKESVNGKKTGMEKNKGFSLVELVISIGILGLILLSISTVLSYVSRTFVRGSADTNMQREIQMVVNQIENMIVDTNGGVDAEEDAEGTKKLILYNAADDGAGNTVYTEEVIGWNTGNQELLYSQNIVSYNAATDDYEIKNTVYTDQLLAQHVTGFEVDISDVVTEVAGDNTYEIVQSVTIEMTCEDGSGNVSYATSPVVTLRNRMIKSDEAKLIFDNTPTQTDTLAIYMASYGVGGVATNRLPVQNMVTSVTRGNTYNLFVMVNAANSVNHLVDWSIEESGATSSIDDTGSLTVTPGEANGSLTIVATYKDNVKKQVKAVVVVENGT